MRVRKNGLKAFWVSRRILKWRRKAYSNSFKENNYAKWKNLNNYHEYLQTPHWKKLSAEYKIKFPKCEVCRVNPTKDIHHKTYARLGRERYWDLMCVCRSCHFNLPHPYRRKFNSSS